MVSAILIFVSCGDPTPEPTIKDPETEPTQIIHDHRIIQSENGRQNYRFETPLLKRYQEASRPFLECPEGVKIETFDDSLRVESDLVADYAHFDETDEKWSARGNVIAHNYKGENVRTLYTERLFWDQKNKRIYSDTTSKVVDGGSVHIGSNFEADENFEEWHFRNTRGQMEVQQRPDSTTSDSTQTDSQPTTTPRAPTSSPSPHTESVNQPSTTDSASNQTASKPQPNKTTAKDSATAATTPRAMTQPTTASAAPTAP